MCRTATPAYTPDLARPGVDMLCRPPQRQADLRTQLRGRHRLIQGRLTGQLGALTVTEPALHLETETLCQTGVITQFRVGVQREMIGKKINAMLEQGLYALPLDPGNAGIFTFPEVSMMHQ